MTDRATARRLMLAFEKVAPPQMQRALEQLRLAVIALSEDELDVIRDAFAAIVAKEQLRAAQKNLRASKRHAARPRPRIDPIALERVQAKLGRRPRRRRSKVGA